MSVGQGQAYESHFGPLSELIDISEFLESVRPAASAEGRAKSSFWAQSANNIEGPARAGWLGLPDDSRRAVIDECSVNDLRSAMNDAIVNPRLMAYATRNHDTSVQSIYETAETNKNKKRKRVTVLDPDTEHPEVATLRDQLDSVQLKSWPLYLNAAMFIRTSKNSDSNTLILTKRLAFKPTITDSNQTLIFITIYDRLQWGHRLIARSSQHVLLSSQTLGDLVEAIPCTSNEIPEEDADENGHVIWQRNPVGSSTGAVVCIEDTLYGDGQTDPDYSERLLEYLQSTSSGQVTINKGPPMHDAPLASFKIHLHKPYWLAHAGDCEHFFTIDLIRLFHPSDPPLSDFPLTIQITPPLLDVCRACNKAPAVYSILGDIRLGETPFVICRPCWRWMGLPKGEAAHQVTVVPLVTHTLGWASG